MKRFFSCLFVLLFVFISVSIATPSYANGPFKKLGRGLANTATGWIEFFVTVQESCEKHDYIGGLFYGIPTGIVKALIRTSIGLYETVTFAIPIPNDYEPILEPEFVTTSPILEKIRAE